MLHGRLSLVCVSKNKAKGFGFTSIPKSPTQKRALIVYVNGGKEGDPGAKEPQKALEQSPTSPAGQESSQQDPPPAKPPAVDSQNGSKERAAWLEVLFRSVPEKILQNSKPINKFVSDSQKIIEQFLKGQSAASQADLQKISQEFSGLVVAQVIPGNVANFNSPPPVTTLFFPPLLDNIPVYYARARAAGGFASVKGQKPVDSLRGFLTILTLGGIVHLNRDEYKTALGYLEYLEGATPEEKNKVYSNILKKLLKSGLTPSEKENLKKEFKTLVFKDLAAIKASLMNASKLSQEAKESLIANTNVVFFLYMSDGVQKAIREASNPYALIADSVGRMPGGIIETTATGGLQANTAEQSKGSKQFYGDAAADDLALFEASNGEAPSGFQIRDLSVLDQNRLVTLLLLNYGPEAVSSFGASLPANIALAKGLSLSKAEVESRLRMHPNLLGELASITDKIQVPFLLKSGDVFRATFCSKDKAHVIGDELLINIFPVSGEELLAYNSRVRGGKPLDGPDLIIRRNNEISLYTTDQSLSFERLKNTKLSYPNVVNSFDFMVRANSGLVCFEDIGAYLSNYYNEAIMPLAPESKVGETLLIKQVYPKYERLLVKQFPFECAGQISAKEQRTSLYKFVLSAVTVNSSSIGKNRLRVEIEGLAQGLDYLRNLSSSALAGNNSVSRRAGAIKQAIDNLTITLPGTHQVYPSRSNSIILSNGNYGNSLGLNPKVVNFYNTVNSFAALGLDLELGISTDLSTVKDSFVSFSLVKQSRSNLSINNFIPISQLRAQGFDSSVSEKYRGKLKSNPGALAGLIIDTVDVKGDSVGLTL